MQGTRNKYVYVATARFYKIKNATASSPNKAYTTNIPRSFSARTNCQTITRNKFHNNDNNKTRKPSSYKTAITAPKPPITIAAIPAPILPAAPVLCAAPGPVALGPLAPGPPAEVAIPEGAKTAVEVTAAVLVQLQSESKEAVV